MAEEECKIMCSVLIPHSMAVEARMKRTNRDETAFHFHCTSCEHHLNCTDRQGPFGLEKTSVVLHVCFANSSASFNAPHDLELQHRHMFTTFRNFSCQPTNSRRNTTQIMLDYLIGINFKSFGKPMC